MLCQINLRFAILFAKFRTAECEYENYACDLCARHYIAGCFW